MNDESRQVTFNVTIKNRIHFYYNVIECFHEFPKDEIE